MKPRYLKMLGGMDGKNGARDWAVYILTCADGSLYTGIAKDARARVKEHNAGRGASYTRMHHPIKLVYQELGKTRAEALRREAEIKTMPRLRKVRLIERWGVELPKLSRSLEPG